jgi:hypothetical protein
LKTLADHSWAVHTNENDYLKYISQSEEDENKLKFSRKFSATVYKTKHPVVLVHPETGKKHLLLGGFAKKIDGYSSSESESLLSIFQSYVTRLENTVRWKWTEGDVEIWDNFATQHYPISDYKEHRVVRRVTVGKGVPVSQNNHQQDVHNEECLQRYLQGLKKMWRRRDDFDHLAVGHGKPLREKTMILDLMQLTEKLLNHEVKGTYEGTSIRRGWVYKENGPALWYKCEK